jgi:hypothetical protein
MDLFSLLVGHLRGAKRSGQRFISAYCPFHKGGQESKRSFMVNVETGGWWCYSCHEKGRIRKLFKMLGAGGSLFEEVAEYYSNVPQRSTYGKYLGIEDDPDPGIYLPEGMLGLYQYCPTSYVNAGFNPSTLWHFEVGFDHARRRITFPIRDNDGQLMGIAGRRMDEMEAQAMGRFSVYTPNELDVNEVFSVDGESLPVQRYRKPYTSQLLWHANDLIRRKHDGYVFDAVVLAEGYKGTMWIHQAGFIDVVSTFGAKLSLPFPQKEGVPEGHYRCQLDTLFEIRPRRIILFFDNDQAGKEATWGSIVDPNKGKLAVKLSRYFPVHVVRYPRADARQPDNLGPTEVLQAIYNAR